MENSISRSNPYNVESTKFNAIGGLAEICSNCFQRSCRCPQTKYRGLLYRKDRASNTEHSTEIDSIYKRPSTLSWIGKEKKITYNPYTTSQPYFNGDGDVCVLENLLDFRMLNEEDKYNNYNMGHFDCVAERALSAKNECTIHKAYFKFRDSEYPFGILNYTPILQKYYLKNIEKRYILGIKTAPKKILYDSSDFITAHLKEERLMERLSDIFEIINAQVTNPYGCRTDLVEAGHKKIVKALSSNHFLEYALCAKQCGNTTLAQEILRHYDIEHTQRHSVLGGYICYLPLSGIEEDTCEYNTHSAQKHKSIFENLNIIADAEKRLKNIERTKIRLFSTYGEMSACDAFIYAKKKINKHTLIVCKAWYGGGHGYNKSAKFKLINAPGDIIKASRELPMFFRLRCLNPFGNPSALLNSIRRMHVTEQRQDQDGDTLLVNHILTAGETIDGSQQTPYLTPLSRIRKLIRPWYTWLNAIQQRIWQD